MAAGCGMAWPGAPPQNAAVPRGVRQMSSHHVPPCRMPTQVSTMGNAAAILGARFAKSLAHTTTVRHNLTKTNDFIDWLHDVSVSRPKERDWFEFFESGQITRLYLDHDYVVNGPVQPDDIHDRIELCRPHINTILRSVPNYSKLSDDDLLNHFVVASRTGDGMWVKKLKNGEEKSGFKVSLRFFLDVAIVYHDIPAYLHPSSVKASPFLNPTARQRH